MAATNCQKLVAEYLGWLKQAFETREFQSGCIISTPFLDRHNDAIELFVEQRNGQLWLTDDGYTVGDLRASGMEFSTEKRKKFLDSILNGFGVRLEGEELCAPATMDDFPQKKHRLLQAILAVNDMFVMAEEHVLSLFKEDVTAFLDSHDISYLADFKLSGKSGYDHKFDFGFPKTRTKPERVMQTVNRLTKDLATSIAFAVGDVVGARRDPLKAFAVINDELDTPNQEHVQAIQAYDIRPLLWTRKEEIVQELDGLS
ncbi:MAG: DUF1828 domain-containing protein [Planctomycetes bacterium]|nr:DUF1828 domain-containing protein [Planctomycetota bacterium]